MAAGKSEQDAVYKHATMIRVSSLPYDIKNMKIKWIIRCKFCNKFLSIKKVGANAHNCYLCNQDLEYQ